MNQLSIKETLCIFDIEVAASLEASKLVSNRMLRAHFL